MNIKRIFTTRNQAIALGVCLATAGSLAISSDAMAATTLAAAAQAPAVLANLSLSVNLTSGAAVPSGQTAVIDEISTAGTHGTVAKQSTTTISYTPGSYYATLAKGSSAQDKFTYCLNDQAGAVSCNTVTVTIFGATQSSSSTTTAVTTPYTCLRNWYVAQNGSDRNAGTSTSVPWLTLQHADSSGLLRAGDCVNVEPGTYPVAATQDMTHGGSANTATGYVVYRSTTPHGAKIVAAATGMQNVIYAGGNYMIFDGFEINGGDYGLTSSPITSGSGIFAYGHHFQALNNLVHDCGGAGIGAVQHDWYWIVGNTVYNNAHFNTGQTSGISIYEPRAVSFTATSADTSATYHILVKNNVSYANSEAHVAGDHSDGNGIIMDDFLNTQEGTTAYPYKSLIQGNTTYGNGARGIHVYLSDYVTVDGNIAYNNNLDDKIIGPWRGELSNVMGSNNTWTNNQAAAISVTTDAQRQYNTAVLDAFTTATTNVVWENNANFDMRTGGKSYRIYNTTRAAAFPAANPLGKAL